jgi:hypothetical protein
LLSRWKAHYVQLRSFTKYWCSHASPSSFEHLTDMLMRSHTEAQLLLLKVLSQEAAWTGHFAITNLTEHPQRLWRIWVEAILKNCSMRYYYEANHCYQ